MRRAIFLYFASCAFLAQALSGAHYRKPDPIIDLNVCERSVHSRGGEDGVIQKIFEVIGSTSKYYVEFDVENGLECNTRYMRQFYGWHGVLMARKKENAFFNLKKVKVTAENINPLFHQYKVPNEFDLLSIHTQSNDFHLWNALSEHYRPRVVVIEYNATHLPHEEKVVKYNPEERWDGSNYFGASILALYKLGRKKGYSLVYADQKGVHLFFIRDDVLSRCPIIFKDANCVERIYRYPHYGYAADPYQREYLTLD